VVALEQERWFNQEVHPHDGQLKAYLRGAFPAVRDVDDVVQESYLRIWRAKAAQPIQSAKAFLFKVARHLALDLVRRNKISPVEAGYDFDLSRVLDSAPDAAQALLNQDLFNHAVDALITLPPRYRDVIVLHKLRGLSHREVAAQLNLTERTAQKYCSVGMERCAEFLKARGITGFFS
jgi:RNA polymerase sigma-70 factor (ECF subfamily)